MPETPPLADARTGLFRPTWLLRVVVIPLTTNTSRVYPGEALVTVDGKPGKVMVDQIMVADKIRPKTRLCTLSKPDMLDVEQAILVHLGVPK